MWATELRNRRHVSGRPTSADTGETDNIKLAMPQVIDLFGDALAERFGPKALKAVQQEMIDEDLCINVINQRVRKIRHVFKWLAGEELIPASTWHGLQAVEALKPGRTAARSTAPVQAVPDEYVEAVRKHAPSTMDAMIQVQYLTGMRPGEVCSMRPIDIEMTGKVWIYRPPQHKSKHHDRKREIPIGPKAQEVIKPFLQRDVTAFLFSPREALRQRYEERPTHRHQPVVPPKTERRVGDRYRAKAHAKCIERICKENGIPHWSPNQLRHNAGTRLRKAFGLDVAQIVLGHSRADVTEIYAEADLQRAVAAMEKVG
jgi:integrase